MRSPQTIGLDTATPASGVFQRMFSPVAALHFTGVGEPSATPDAAGPRNDGQCWPDTEPHASTQAMIVIARRRIYLPSTRVKTVGLGPWPIATEVTLSCSRPKISANPGMPAAPNRVASRATNVNR